MADEVTSDHELGGASAPLGEIALPDMSAITAAEGDLTVEEATYLTEMIRATADMMWVLLSRAHAGKAWKALGYDSFAAYVHSEFNISRSRAYQLLSQARVIEALEAAAPEGTQVSISEAAARDVKDIVDDLAPQISQRTEGMDPDLAAVEIEAIVEEARAGLNSGDPISVDGEPWIPGDLEITPPGYGDDDAPWREPETGPVPGRGGQPEPPANLPGIGGDDAEPPVRDFVDLDDDDWDDDEEDDVPATPAKKPQDSLLDDEDDEEEVNPALLRRRVQSAYDLYSTLMTMSEMPDPQDVISIIPVERRLLIDQSIDSVIDWLTQFRDQWNAQPWKTPTDPQ